MKRFLGGSFQLVPSPGNDMCQQKCTPCNATFFVGSMIGGPTDTSKILMPIPRPGQEPSIYISLIPVRTTDSLIFVVVCKNILYCLNLGRDYLWTRAASNKNDRLYQRASHKHINWSNGLWKNSSYS